MKKTLEKLSQIHKLTECVFYIIFYSTLTFLALNFCIIFILVPILSGENLLILSDKLFMIIEKFRWYLIALFILAGLYSIGRIIIDAWQESRERKATFKRRNTDN